MYITFTCVCKNSNINICLPNGPCSYFSHIYIYVPALSAQRGPSTPPMVWSLMLPAASAGRLESSFSKDSLLNDRPATPQGGAGGRSFSKESLPNGFEAEQHGWAARLARNSY